MKKLKNGLVYLITFITIFMSIGTLNVQAEEYEPYDMRVSKEIMSTEDRTAAKENAYAMEVQSNNWKNWPEGVGTYGEAAIVMEAQSGAILYAKNIDGIGYPASITKVLTTLIALENGELDDTITVTQESLDCLGGGYAHIGLKAGEELSLEDILHAVLLASANEASHAVASSLGENYDMFIEEMNNRTKELGGTESNFVNTNGVHDENHYTTAKEMALITQELLVNHPEFEEISQTLQYTIGETNLTTESRTFQQKHKMLLESSEHYDPRVIAGKTGYTDAALNTLITCAEDENLQLIVVLLKTYEGAVYEDTANLLDYGFDNFEKISITKEKITSEVTDVAAGSYVVVPKGVTFEDLEQELVKSDNDEEGTVVYTYNGQTVGNVEVSLKSETSENVSDAEEETEEGGFSIIKMLVIVLIIAAVLFALYMMLVIYVKYKRKMERRRRRARRRQRMLEMEREQRRRLELQEERERRRQQLRTQRRRNE